MCVSERKRERERERVSERKSGKRERERVVVSGRQASGDSQGRQEQLIKGLDMGYVGRLGRGLHEVVGVVGGGGGGGLK